MSPSLCEDRRIVDEKAELDYDQDENDNLRKEEDENEELQKFTKPEKTFTGLELHLFRPRTESDGAYVQRLGVSLGRSPHDVGTTQQAVTQPEIKLSSGKLQIE